MTTTDKSIHDRVIEAFAKDAELQAQQVILQAKLLAAKQAQDAVRLSPVLADAKIRMGKIRTEAIGKANDIRLSTIAQAKKPFDAALAKFNAATDAATGAYAKVNDEQNALYESQVNAVLKQCELETAAAQATVHNLQQQIAAHQQSISMHRRNMQDRLGIDTSKVLG